MVQSAEGLARFRVAKTSKWGDANFREQTVERQFRYVPRSHQFGPDIPGTTHEKICKIASRQGLRWWQPSDDGELYSPIALQEAIRDACASFYRTGSVLPTVGAQETRDELLQRSQLMSVGSRFLDASAVNCTELPFWILHRCYLYRSHIPGASGWNIVVHRYPRGPQQHGYTQYLNSQCEGDPGVLAGLLSASAAVEV